MRYNPYAEKRTGPIEPPSLSEIGQKVYAKNCASCHQASGQGVPGAFPTLHGTQWVTGNERRVINILISGLVGEIEVLGDTYNGNMPAWGNILSDNEIAGVVTYIRQNEEWGNQASEVTEEEVAAVRSEFGVLSQAWNGNDLLEQFPDTETTLEEAPEENTETMEEENSSNRAPTG